MNCKDVRENLVELLDPTLESQADSALVAHVRECGACAQELESLRKTMTLLDEWEAPEPSPYFLTRLGAHVKEEREKTQAPGSSGSLAWTWTRWMRRPALALSLSAVLVAGGLVYLGTRSPKVDPASGTPVADLQMLDKNQDVLTNTDLIDELSGGPSDDVMEQ
jgi:anti-sigma factor RsiW